MPTHKRSQEREPSAATPAVALPPKKQGVRALAKEQTRKKVIAAARRLFVEVGYDASTVRKIASIAGVSLGPVFHYATDKRDLIFLIFNEQMDSLTDKALAAPEPWQTFPEKILSITELHYQVLAVEPELSRILLSEVLQRSPGRHMERHFQIRARLIAGFEQLISAAQQTGEIKSLETPELIARTIFFSFFTATCWWLDSPDPTWRVGQRDFARVLNVTMAGLTPRPELPAQRSATAAKALGKGSGKQNKLNGRVRP